MAAGIATLNRADGLTVGTKFLRIWKNVSRIGSSRMGSLAKGFLRKVCGNSAEFAKITFDCEGFLRKVCGHFTDRLLLNQIGNHFETNGIADPEKISRN